MNAYKIRENEYIFGYIHLLNEKKIIEIYKRISRLTENSFEWLCDTFSLTKNKSLKMKKYSINILRYLLAYNVKIKITVEVTLRNLSILHLHGTRLLSDIIFV